MRARNWFNGGISLRRLGGLVGCLLVGTLIFGIETAQAGCMAAPTAQLRRLANLSSRSPAEVLAATNTATADPIQTGWQAAARAEAYDALSRPPDARRTAQAMLNGKVVLDSPLYIELLSRFAMNGFHSDEIDKAFPQVEAARRRAAPASAADACLQISLGEMQRMRGLPERAVVYLANAYRATAGITMERQHILAAEKLARVIDAAGDHQQAISLIEEVIAWDEAKGRTLALSNDFYFRGVFNLGREAYQAALADFEHSRALASAGVDPVGSAFLDLQICATLIKLRSLDRAQAMCHEADRTFTRHGEISAAQAQLQLARIEYARGFPARALPRLDRLLANREGLASFASVPEAFKLRSDVNKRLGRSQRAFEDLQQYVQTSDRQRSSEQAKQNAVLRARFETDRAAVRNEELQRKLQYVTAREQEQAKRYAILSLSAMGGILLLIVIAIMSSYHRRKLTTLANTDPLTGLFNRRFVNQHEKVLIANHAKTGASLTVAIIDIDHFKAVNDNHGHDAGDEVLIAFASAIRGAVRKCDFIARWGGEEFIIIFPNANEAEAVEALKRVRSALDKPVVTAAGAVCIRFSAGVASFRGVGSLHSVAQQADEALYRAKSSGRDKIETAPPKPCLMVVNGAANVLNDQAASLQA